LPHMVAHMQSGPGVGSGHCSIAAGRRDKQGPKRRRVLLSRAPVPERALVGPTQPV
jgi:hypothetical protein